jgi:hypothetical protein
MEWCKLSTSYYQDIAILRAGEAAEILFLRMIAYSGSQETSGCVPAEVIPMLTPLRSKARIDALLASNLISKQGETYFIRSWNRHQESLDSESVRRRKDRDRKRIEREKAILSQDTSQDTARDHPGMKRDSSTRIEVEVEVEEEKESSKAAYEGGLVTVLRGSATPPAGTAAEIVASFVKGAVALGFSTPGQRQRDRVGRDAMGLLRDGVDHSQLMRAAHDLGQTAYDDLGKQLRILEASEAGVRPSGRSLSRVEQGDAVLARARARLTNRNEEIQCLPEIC